MKSECSVVDCSQSVVARGLCSRHWKRWSHYGDPTESRSRTLEDAQREPELLPGEEWRSVVGWEGLYEVSNLGRVRSLKRESTDRNGVRRILSGRVMSQNPDTRGHLSIRLSRPGTKQTVRVHRLVLEAFVGPAPEGAEGCHWDDDKSNNRVENLRWGTRSDNMNDRVRNGGHPYANRDSCSRGHKYTPENTRMRGNTRLCRTCLQSQARIDYERKKQREGK